MTQHIKQARDAISRMIENGSCPESIAPHIDTILDLLGKEIDGGWQPIETAPKDVKILMGVWYNNTWYEDVGTQFGKQGRRTICTGFRKNEWPTHWMPLPQPPAKEE